MHFKSERLIQKFWHDFDKAENKEHYIRLLDNAETMTIKLMASLEGEDFVSFYDNSPLLAMVSEVLFECPEAVTQLAEHNSVFAAALEMLQDYPENERIKMQNIFLPRTNTVISFKVKKEG